MHLRGEIGHSCEGCEGYEGVFVDGFGEIAVVEEGGELEGSFLEVGGLGFLGLFVVFLFGKRWMGTKFGAWGGWSLGLDGHRHRGLCLGRLG